MEKPQKFNLVYTIIAILGIFIAHDIWVRHNTVQPVPYSEFEALMEQGKVAKVTIREKSIVGELKEADASGKRTVVANRVDPGLAARFSAFEVPYTQVHESRFLATLLSWVAPALIFFGIWFLLVRKMMQKQGGAGGFMNIGKSKAKIYVEQETGVDFDDVAGIDEGKAELVEIVDYLRAPREYGALGARMPKGILLVAPPVPARPSWPAPWPARRAWPSSPSAAPNLWRCSSAWARPGSGTSSNRPANRHQPSSSSTNSTPWAVPGARAMAWGETTSGNRP